MAMSGYYIYRVLREDEDPLRDGIMGKCPTRDKDPAYHIRQCSSEDKGCQWISTCATQKGLEKMLALKRKKIANDVFIRHVIINRVELEDYAAKCRRSIDDNVALLEEAGNGNVRTVPYREKTGNVLDFTDGNVVETFLPERPQGNIPRNYAAAYEEVLVECFIPPHCCNVVHLTDVNNKVLDRPTCEIRYIKKTFRLDL